MSAPTPADLARQHGATWAAQQTEDELMKTDLRQYWPDHEAPDYGGLDGRFGRLFERYYARPDKGWNAVSAIMCGAIVGLLIAAMVAP